MKRLACLAIFFTSLVFAFSSTAARAADLQVGRDYTVIDPPQSSGGPGKIEVVEFFSYACPHCSDFSPLVTAWSANLPKDVVFRRVPVSFNRPPWARLAGIYYSLDATGNLEKLDALVFAAVHKDRINFDSNESFATWASGKGADGKKIADAMNSFGVQTRLKQGDQEATRYGISGVPAMAVNGRYLVNNTAAPNYGSLLKLVDLIVAKARSETATK